MISHFPHIAVSLSMPSSCPQLMVVAGVFPNCLSLVFQYGYERCNDDDRGNWHANFSFDYIHYLRIELKNQALPRACWKNCKNVLASANKIQANFLLIVKRFDIQEMLNCVVYSSSNVHDSITDVHLPPYRIPHQCHQCSRVNRCHNPPNYKRVYWNPVYRNNPLLRMFTGIPSLLPHSPPVFFPLVFPMCNLTCSPTIWPLRQASQNSVHFALYNNYYEMELDSSSFLTLFL